MLNTRTNTNFTINFTRKISTSKVLLLELLAGNSHVRVTLTF